MFNVATRLMAQLRYPKKFLIVSVLFAAPTLVLLFFVWFAAIDDIAFAKQERRGVELLKHLYPLWVSSLDTPAAGSSPSSIHLKALQQSNAEVGEDLQVAKEVTAVALQLESTSSSATDSVSSKLFDLIAQINDNSNLILDPETASYYVGDLTIGKLPSLVNDLTQAQLQIEQGQFNEQKTQLILLTAPDRLNATRQQIESAIRKVNGSEPAVAMQLQSAFQILSQQLEQYSAQYQRQIVQPLQSQQLPTPNQGELKRRRTAVIEAANQLSNLGYEQLDLLLKQRIEGRRIKLLVAFSTALIAFLSAAWLLTGFYLSTQRNLQRLKTAFQNVADGDFSIPQALSGNDELTELNVGLGRLVENLRDFSAEQINMANAHENGDIHCIMNSERFSGGYREMVERVNELVRSHTGIQMKMVALTSLYTQGEYSLHMDSMKGLKAMISTEIDHVRERMELAASEAEFTLRVKQALDQVSTPVQIADEQGKIMYYNLACKARFAQHAGLNNVSDLLHTRLNSLLQHANQLQGMVKHTRSADVRLGTGTYTVTLSPILDTEEKIVGQVVEWQDRTDELATANEIATLVNRAANGDLSGRIDLTGKTGFFAELGQNLNQLLNTNEQGLSDINQILAALARGDLTQEMTGQRKGIFDELQQNANTTISQLSQIIAEIRGASSAVADSVNSLVGGNTELTERSHRQAEASKKTAQTAAKISAMVKSNAETTASASQLASTASKQANAGRETMDQVTNAMARLTQSARQIADITSLIDGIAFQTNILALNAAVEAARAGDSGRGFAVVAAEVRNLAQRSASAAKDIKTLIDASVTEIHQGHQLATQSATQVHDVVNQVRSLTDMLKEIDHASREQSMGVNEMSQSIAAIDTDVQENRALSNRLSQNSSEMMSQTQRLDSAVSVFQT